MLLDDADVFSVTVPAKEKGKNEDGKATYQEVQLTDCLDSWTWKHWSMHVRRVLRMSKH